MTSLSHLVLLQTLAISQTLAWDIAFTWPRWDIRKPVPYISFDEFHTYARSSDPNCYKIITDAPPDFVYLRARLGDPDRPPYAIAVYSVRNEKYPGCTKANLGEIILWDDTVNNQQVSNIDISGAKYWKPIYPSDFEDEIVTARTPVEQKIIIEEDLQPRDTATIEEDGWNVRRGDVETYPVDYDLWQERRRRENLPTKEEVSDDVANYAHRFPNHRPLWPAAQWTLYDFDLANIRQQLEQEAGMVQPPSQEVQEEEAEEAEEAEADYELSPTTERSSELSEGDMENNSQDLTKGDDDDLDFDFDDFHHPGPNLNAILAIDNLNNPDSNSNAIATDEGPNNPNPSSNAIPTDDDLNNPTLDFNAILRNEGPRQNKGRDPESM